jgi:hypothetical protein
MPRRGEPYKTSARTRRIGESAEPTPRRPRYARHSPTAGLSLEGVVSLTRSHSRSSARRRVTLAALVVAVLSSAAGMGAEPEREPAAIAVIVGKASAITAISRDELREIYLRRQRLWPGGARVVPINLPADHPARARFSQLVLGRSASDLMPYWNTRYFEGVTPPAVVRSPAAVRAYLAAEPDAIAYLPLADVDETCRVVLVLGR